MMDLMEEKNRPENEAAKKSFTFRLMFACFLLFGFYVAVFNTYDEFRDSIQEEVEISTQELGKDGPDVAKNAIDMFEGIMNWPLFKYIDKEVSDRTNQRHSAVQEQVGKFKEVKFLGGMLSDIGLKLILMMYQACFRLAMLGYWAFVILPLGCALIFEAFTRRRIKMFEFKSNSVKKQKMWAMVLSMGFLMLNIYLIVPYATWLGKYFPVIALLIMITVFSNIISHVTKTF